MPAPHGKLRGNDFLRQDFLPASATRCMVGCRRRTSRHRTAMACVTKKIRCQSDAGVERELHERGSEAAVHMVTAAVEQDGLHGLITVRIISKVRPCANLTGMIEAICGPLVMGNTMMLVVPTEAAELAIALAECIAVSDVPAGVVNILTGDVDSVIRVAARHDDLDGLYLVGAPLSHELLTEVRTENARVMRRLVQAADAETPAPPGRLAQLAEVKTVWMSSALMAGGGTAY